HRKTHHAKPEIAQFLGLASAGFASPGHSHPPSFLGLARQALMPNIPVQSCKYKRHVNGLPDCLNHTRFVVPGRDERAIRRSNSGVGMMRLVSQWMLAAAAALPILAAATASQAQQTIRVGWTIPAEESKYWMMRRPQEFPDIGKTY